MTRSILQSLPRLSLPVFLFVFLPASDRLAAAEASPAEIERAIRQLGSDKFEEREAASKRLEAIGPPALDSLRKAVAGGDLEIKRRAEKLIERLERLQVGEVRVFTGHAELINDATFSADGRKIASASWDGTVRVWDVETGKELQRFDGGRYASCVAFSRDGRRLLSGSGDKVVCLWDVEGGKQILRLEGHTSTIWGLAWTRDGRQALSCSDDMTIRLWDLTTGEEKRRYEDHTERVWCLALSPDGRRMLSGGGSLISTGQPSSCKIRLWDVETGKVLRQLEGHTADVRRVAFSPDGRRALSGGFDKTVRLWDVETGKELRRFDGHGNFVEAVAFTPDGHFGVSCSGGALVEGRLDIGTDHSIRVWDLQSGKQVHQIRVKTGPLYKIEVSPDGRYLLTGCKDNCVRLWRMPK